MYGRTHRIHLIGIGGSGMCGIAEVLLTMGYQVSGSDMKASDVTDRLVSLGGRVFVGHAASNMEGADVVVFSTAVPADNPELVEARRLGVPVIGRAEMLAELMRMKYGIAVGGAHGKTTTTSMVAAVLARGGLDPTIVVGGRLRALGTHARLGHGQFLVAEADESDGSFLRLSPALTVITNIDREHLDHYGSLEEVRQAFVYFANRVPFYGVTVLCIDDPEVREILPRVTKRVLRYGLGPDAELRATDIELLPHGSRFTVASNGRVLGVIEMQVPGQHNVLNALAAIGVGLEIEIGFAHIAEGLADFHGVARRFETRGEQAGVRVVDDYAHHPTEIAATLAAARGLGGRRLVLFQPHRFSRTQALAREFGGVWKDADHVWVLDVYAAGEKPLAGVSGRTVVESAEAQGAKQVRFAPDAAAAVREIELEARAGDVVLTLGAGDVWKLADEILKGLSRRQEAPSGEPIRRGG
ncbi:MAG: UDP-N-acetylmuramate--L-alanine ligase [Candidatus Eisenbacteria bacterium]|uniref:UDP-N-acetylmuramate--L-alanine ligase n=1 Tax=Eiseniibacteriota bacterium TaxID=2212470 RepID=A0A849SNV5_UNCEI|nr:UDP-N-acetylmuramate--L-alanine ligase [Candidatus Eisenbacteria bacterium]